MIYRNDNEYIFPSYSIILADPQIEFYANIIPFLPVYSITVWIEFYWFFIKILMGFNGSFLECNKLESIDNLFKDNACGVWNSFPHNYEVCLVYFAFFCV